VLVLDVIIFDTDADTDPDIERSHNQTLKFLSVELSGPGGRSAVQQSNQFLLRPLWGAYF